jgi:hypothetical protein
VVWAAFLQTSGVADRQMLVMGKPKETPDGTRPDSAKDKVESWRLHVLIGAGYPLILAEQLAVSDADLHACEEILRRGCNPTIAAEILL